jgi:hypothetical protein
MTNHSQADTNASRTASSTPAGTNRSRVELLKEMKGLAVQLLEIKEQLRSRSA